MSGHPSSWMATKNAVGSRPGFRLSQDEKQFLSYAPISTPVGKLRRAQRDGWLVCCLVQSPAPDPLGQGPLSSVGQLRQGIETGENCIERASDLTFLDPG